MKGIPLSVLATGLLVLHLPAQAALIHGTYSGTVVAGGSGMTGTLNASTVAAGTPIYGTFSYDPKIFTVNVSHGAEGSYFTFGSATPLVFTVTVAGSTFTVPGIVQSVLTVDAFASGQIPNNHIYLEAMNYGATASPDSLSGSISFYLSNYLGAPFATDVNNPGSVAFAHQSGYVGTDVDTLQALDSVGNGIAALYFKITDASTVMLPAERLSALFQEAKGIAPEGLEDKVESAQFHTQATCLQLKAFVIQAHNNATGIGALTTAKLIADATVIETSIG